MLWKLLQLIVFFAVCFTGIYYQWTPNSYVLGLLSIGAAFFTTLLLNGALNLWQRFFVKQRDQGGPAGWR